MVDLGNVANFRHGESLERQRQETRHLLELRRGPEDFILVSSTL